jgi:hypothetical protein
MDIGIKGGYLPTFAKSVLTSSGISAAYNYQKGSIGKSIGSDKSFTVKTDQSSATTITAGSPALAVGWESNSFDLTAQMSKKLLFFIPYGGLGCSFGKTSVTGGVTSAIGTDYSGGISGLKKYFAANGGPSIDSNGFTYTASETSPVFRVYGGFSLRILVVDLDAQAMYVPAAKSLGATLTARVQI